MLLRLSCASESISLLRGVALIKASSVVSIDVGPSVCLHPREDSRLSSSSSCISEGSGISKAGLSESRMSEAGKGEFGISEPSLSSSSSLFIENIVVASLPIMKIPTTASNSCIEGNSSSRSNICSLNSTNATTV